MIISAPLVQFFPNKMQTAIKLLRTDSFYIFFLAQGQIHEKKEVIFIQGIAKEIHKNIRMKMKLQNHTALPKGVSQLWGWLERMAM